VTGPGYDDIETYRDLSELTEKPCQNETVVIFVHGWEESDDNVKERLNRVKLSLENNSFIHPLIGFSWPSDTVWFSAKFIAAENGPKLANPPFQIYPSFEADRALGQSGYQKIPYNISQTKSLPKNYAEIDVQDQLPLNIDADGDRVCDFRIPGTNICMITEIGDNHRGYLGYRNPDDNSTIIDNGVINIVVDNWINRTSTRSGS
jgi:hypothetical protein